jgi:acetyltransferase-like isoleucine patch superfamily enzyme
MRVYSLAHGLAALVRRVLVFRPMRAAMRVEMASDALVEGRVWIRGTGRVRIGSGARLVGRRSPIELHTHDSGEIVLGDGVLVEDGTSIEATSSVHVGANARIGAFCKIIDNHFHHTTGDRFDRPEGVPVTVGQGAVVGPRSVLLPGAEVGAGARLGPAMVLSFHLPPGEELPEVSHRERAA